MRIVVFRIIREQCQFILGHRSLISFSQDALAEQTALLVSLVNEPEEQVALEKVISNYPNSLLGCPITNKIILPDELDYRDWLAPYWYEQALEEGISTMLLQENFPMKLPI